MIDAYIAIYEHRPRPRSMYASSSPLHGTNSTMNIVLTTSVKIVDTARDLGVCDW